MPDDDVSWEDFPEVQNVKGQADAQGGTDTILPDYQDELPPPATTIPFWTDQFLHEPMEAPQTPTIYDSDPIMPPDTDQGFAPVIPSTHDKRTQPHSSYPGTMDNPNQDPDSYYNNTQYLSWSSFPEI